MFILFGFRMHTKTINKKVLEIKNGGVRMGELPLAPIERILKKAGAGRVSKKAAKEFASVLEDIASELAAECAALAKHAGRKTVMAKDVRLAKKKGF